MRLAAVAANQRLIPQNQLLVHDHVSDGQEEPFALADIGGVFAATASLCPESLAGLGALDLGGLEGLLGLPYGANRGALRDGGDEPVAFIVAAKELTTEATLARYRAAWDHAADRTPHGTPIELKPEDFA